MISKLTSIISVILFLALSPLYVYAQSMNMSNTTSTTVYSNNILYIILALGILFGIYSIVVISLGLKNLGGKISNTFKFIIVGIVFMIVAFLWTAIDTYFNILSMNYDMLVHMSLMLIGMIIFVISAFKFINISKS